MPRSALTIVTALSQAWCQQWSVVVSQVAGAELGIDPEYLHRLRVALRQSRALLKFFKRELPGSELDHFAAEFKWLAAATGAVRDFDVLLENLRTWAEGNEADAKPALQPVVDYLEEQRVPAQRRLRQVLAGQRFRRLGLRWQRFLTALSEQAPHSAPARPLVALKIAKRSLRLLRGGLALVPSTSAPELHRLRIQAKRLRYTLQSFEALLRRRRAYSVFVVSLKNLQQELGDYRDCDLARARVSTLLEREGWPQALPWLAMWRDELAMRRQRARAAIDPAVAAFAAACKKVPV